MIRRFFKNFAEDFGSSATKESFENLKYSSEKLFNRLVNKHKNLLIYVCK